MVSDWQISWNALGPFTVDSWNSSYKNEDGTPVRAYRVIGVTGFQCHNSSGMAVMFDSELAQAVALAANMNELIKEPSPNLSCKSTSEEIQKRFNAYADYRVNVLKDTDYTVDCLVNWL